MWTIQKTRGITFRGAKLGLSAARLWEHTQRRQINPFAPITRQTAQNPALYLDVTEGESPLQPLTGLTLQDLRDKRYPHLNPSDAAHLLYNIQCRECRQWMASVQAHLETARQEQAARNRPTPFLPAGDGSPLGVAGLKCALQIWLNARRDETAPLAQWMNRLRKLTQQGLRGNELDLSGLSSVGALPGEGPVTGESLLRHLDYREARLSIVPVVQTARQQLDFVQVTNTLPARRMEPRRRKPLRAHPVYRDPIMGYWIDQIAWEDLFRDQPGWRALTCRGQVVTSPANPTGICRSAEEAMTLASAHAHTVLPKLTAQGTWSRYSISGGEHYREWLVTLPHYRFCHYNPHFPHRNVLLHLRCDIRADEDGQRILLMQEAQSDWAQAFQRAGRTGDASAIPAPPWAQEWPALALKLMLLHAASRNVDGLAWTTGAMQVRRYGGRGQKWLHRLYDEMLPHEAQKLLRKYQVPCQPIRVRVPDNFTIRPAEFGYEVLDEEGHSLGAATSWEEARLLLPDDAREQVVSMHGIGLDMNLREAIMEDGFYGWGHGIL